MRNIRRRPLNRNQVRSSTNATRPLVTKTTGVTTRHDDNRYVNGSEWALWHTVADGFVTQQNKLLC